MPHLYSFVRSSVSHFYSSLTHKHIRVNETSLSSAKGAESSRICASYRFEMCRSLWIVPIVFAMRTAHFRGGISGYDCHVVVVLIVDIHIRRLASHFLSWEEKERYRLTKNVM